MAELRGVLWDMDGTLLDSEKLWEIAVYELSDYLGGAMTTATRHALIGSSGANAMRIVYASLGVSAPTPAQIADAGGFMERRVSELFAGPIPWRPGAKDALGLVLDAGLPMALVTNTKRSLAELALDTVGREYFAATVCADEVAHGKPEPDVYLRAAELLGLPIGACVAIEDSPTGVVAAERAGCRVLCVPCEIPVPEGPGRVLRESLLDLTIADLKALVS